MRFVLGIIILISVIIESSLVTYPITLVCIALLSLFLSEEVCFWAFGAGLLLDIFLLRLWGATVLLFLIMTYVFALYEKRLNQEGNFFYQFVIALVFVTIYSYVFYHTFQPIQLIVAFAFGLILYYVIRYFFPKRGNKKRLSV
jgi:hypothetical protein